jgi:anti-sigma factor RsiW
MGENMHDHEQCRALFEKLSEYIDRELDQVTCETIEKHMAQCKPCQTCLSTLKRTVALCREMEPASVPELMSQRLRDLISQNLG